MRLKDRIEIIECDRIRVFVMPEKEISYIVTSPEELKDLYEQANELGIKWFTGDRMDFYSIETNLLVEMAVYGSIKLNFRDGFNMVKEATIFATWESNRTK